jgi:hypothetical protein
VSIWQPTHRVPPGGLPSWSQPDGSAPPSNRLDEALEVAVAQWRGPWAWVVCENGFTTWVDGRQLLPRAAPRGRGGIVAAVGALVVVVVAVLAIVVAGGGDDDGGGSAGRDVDVPELEPTTIALNVPEGWSVSDDGLTAVEDPADLTAAEPAGPTVRATTGDALPALDDPALLDLRVAGDDFELSEPEEQTVDGQPAVVVTMRGQGRVLVLIAVDPPGQEGAFFTIDCPADRFDELRDLLGGVPGVEA